LECKSVNTSSTLDTLDEYGLAASGLPGRGDKAAGRLRQMGALGAEAGQTMLAEAEAFVRSRVPASTVIRRVQRTGIPEHEIIAAALRLPNTQAYCSRPVPADTDGSS